jgi:hypothetical protein
VSERLGFGRVTDSNETTETETWEIWLSNCQPGEARTVTEFGVTATLDRRPVEVKQQGGASASLTMNISTSGEVRRG